MTYHLHLETFRKRPQHFYLTEELWRAAAERHPELASRLRVTRGTCSSPTKRTDSTPNSD